jgi:hypothetical protein
VAAIDVRGQFWSFFGLEVIGKWRVVTSLALLSEQG